MYDLSHTADGAVSAENLAVEERENGLYVFLAHALGLILTVILKATAQNGFIYSSMTVEHI